MNQYEKSNPVLFHQLEELVSREPQHYGSFLRGSCKHVMEWCMQELDAVGCHPSKIKVAVHTILHGLSCYPSCAICGKVLQDKDLVNIQQGFHKTCSNRCRARYFSAVIATDEWKRELGDAIHEAYQDMDDDAHQRWLLSVQAYHDNATQEQKARRVQSYKDTVSRRSDIEKRSLSLHISNGLRSMSSEQRARWRRNVSAGLASMAQEAKDARNAKIGRKNRKRHSEKSVEEKEKTRLALRDASASRSQEAIDRMTERCAATKRKNGTFNSSKPEQTTYEMLVKTFGKDDVVRQFKSDRYPFSVDFYVKSLDLFIECNYSWTHKGHWYDPKSNEDRIEAEKMYHRYESTGKRYYKNAADTWTIRDMKKHNVALQNNLNYLVFWNLEEAMNYDFNMETMKR